MSLSKCSSRICPSFVSLQEEKDLKLADFTGYQDTRWEKEKGTMVEEVLKKSGLPNSLSLTRTQDKHLLALSYQVTDGLVSLTLSVIRVASIV